MHTSIPEILISKVLSREASADEIEQLNVWLSASSDNKKVFEEYILIYNNQPIKVVEFDAKSAFRKIEPTLESKKPAITRLTYLSIAASLILLISLGVFYFNTRQATAEIEGEWQTFTTGSRERKSFKLIDGSIISLNSESTIKWRKSFANEPVREVFLEGEAFFEVSPDSLRPFVVQTSNISTRVLGTSFNINSNNGIIRVTVSTGKVRVEHPDSQSILSPKQQFTYQSEDQKWWIDQVRPDDISAWKSGVLLFENTRMDTAAIALEKWYDTKIYFQDLPIKNCRITGRFRDETLLHVLDAIKEATGIEYEVVENNVNLMGTKCK